MIYFESRIDKCLTRNVIRVRMATAAKGKDSLLFVVYLFQQKIHDCCCYFSAIRELEK